MYFQPFADQIIHILPQKLHKQDENGHKKGQDQRSDKISNNITIGNFHNNSLEIA